MRAAFVSVLLLLGCAGPRAGEGCSSIEDTRCAPDDRLTILACFGGVYEAVNCREVCEAEGHELLECAWSEERGHDVCVCVPPPPCEGLSEEFFGALSTYCQPPADGQARCFAGVIATCDPETCLWTGDACPSGLECTATCADERTCGQLCRGDE